MSLISYIKSYSLTCKKDLEPSKYDRFLILGTFVHEEFESLKQIQNRPCVYLSPIEDTKYSVDTFIKYEVGSEEGILALLLNFYKNQDDEELEKFLDELDMGYLSAESSVSEEEIEELCRDGEIALVLGYDLIQHPKAQNLVKFLTLIAKYTNITIIAPFMDEDICSDEVYFADDVESIDAYNGAVIYKTPFGNRDLLLGSQQFAIANRLQNGSKVSVKEQTKEFKVVEELKGTIGLLAMEDSSYRYEIVKIKRVGNE